MVKQLTPNVRSQTWLGAKQNTSMPANLNPKHNLPRLVGSKGWWVKRVQH